MCLIALAWHVHPAWPLVVAANRDEFHRRPSSALHWWADRPDVVGGRDLQAGGTWLAASRTGRVATVTNYREDLKVQTGDRSRGELVIDFVTGSSSPLGYAQAVHGERFAGFSLLAATPEAVAYVSNRGDPARLLAPGIYGLSNASLDTPWPKVLRSKKRLQTLLDENAVSATTLFELLADRQPAGAKVGPASDLPAEQARAVSAPFIVTPEFGTRCSTVVLLGARGDAELHERSFDAAGRLAGESTIEFRMT